MIVGAAIGHGAHISTPMIGRHPGSLFPIGKLRRESGRTNRVDRRLRVSFSRNLFPIQNSRNHHATMPPCHHGETGTTGTARVPIYVAMHRCADGDRHPSSRPFPTAASSATLTSGSFSPLQPIARHATKARHGAKRGECDVRDLWRFSVGFQAPPQAKPASSDGTFRAAGRPRLVRLGLASLRLARRGQPRVERLP